MKLMRIGVDLAKNVFQIHGVDCHEKPLWRQRKGFTWLTHIADPNALAETLKVIWVFETLADRKLAQVDSKARIFELTTIALNEVGIDLSLSDRNVRLDSEEECQRIHGGDWQKRMAKGY